MAPNKPRRTNETSGAMDSRSLKGPFFEVPSIQFNQPVDHINSRLNIKRGTEIVETLVPRLESAPNALFARAPALPNGSYILHWVIKTVADSKIEEGEVLFSVSLPK